MYLQVKNHYICVTADTLYAEDSLFLTPNSPQPVPIWLKNTLPLDTFILAFSFPDSGDAILDYDGYSVAGTRAEGFSVSKRAELSDKIVLRFTAPTGSVNPNPLPPGDGVVVNLLFTATGGPSAGIDTTSLAGYSTVLDSRYAEYSPAFVPITIILGLRGDANSDGSINVGDAVFVINYIFKFGTPPNEYEGDANSDGAINVGDAVYLINYVFKNGPPPLP